MVHLADAGGRLPGCFSMLPLFCLLHCRLPKVTANKRGKEGLFYDDRTSAGWPAPAADRGRRGRTAGVSRGRVAQ